MTYNRLTARDLTRAIAELPKNQRFEYINPVTKGRIEIVGVEFETVRIRRSNSHIASPKPTKVESISANMLWRIANAFIPNIPINFDRVLGASYNTRSVLESLLAHTPEFYVCYPKRIEITSSSTEIKTGHKHLMWCPDNPHQPNRIVKIDTDLTISEMPSDTIIYDSLVIPDDHSEPIDIDIKRRHAQIQIALVLIGQHLGYRSWIARNDRGIKYRDEEISKLQNVIARLEDEKTLASYPDAIRAALLIDCIWFRETRFIPAIIEIEHSTGVTSGLSRMKTLFDQLPRQFTRYVIVAADEEREKVRKEINKPQFSDLQALFFPYSAVEELYALCQKRNIRTKGITEDFLDYYMESLTE